MARISEFHPLVLWKGFAESSCTVVHHDNLGNVRGSRELLTASPPDTEQGKDTIPCSTWAARRVGRGQVVTNGSICTPD